jgi:hypothetical protein
MKKIIVILLVFCAGTLAIKGFAAEKVTKAQLVFENEYLPESPPVSDSKEKNNDSVVDQVHQTGKKVTGNYPATGESTDGEMCVGIFIILSISGLLWQRRQKT